MRLAHWLTVGDVVLAAQRLRDLVVRSHHDFMSVLAIVEVEVVLGTLLVDRPLYSKVLSASRAAINTATKSVNMVSEKSIAASVAHNPLVLKRSATLDGVHHLMERHDA
jgi:hypothetical protein